MPWYEYRCEACSAAVRRKVPVAHREATLVHRVEGCEHGRLRRVAPLAGPGDHPASGGTSPRAHALRTAASSAAPAPRAAPSPAAPPPAGPQPSADLSGAVQAIGAMHGVPRLELARALVGLLPTLSEKLALVELVGEARGAGHDLADRLATEVASATPGALAEERRLLGLLGLARRLGRLAPAELALRLEHDGVAARLLASALRWTKPEGATAPQSPPRLDWTELLELVDGAALRARCRHLAEHMPASADVSVRVAVKLAVRELDAVLAGADGYAADLARGTA